MTYVWMNCKKVESFQMQSGEWSLKKSLMTCLDNKWWEITEMLQTFYTDLLDSKAVVKSSQDFYSDESIVRSCVFQQIIFTVDHFY